MRVVSVLLGATEATRRTLGVLAHGSDVIVHLPIGIVGATKASEQRISAPARS